MNAVKKYICSMVGIILMLFIGLLVYLFYLSNNDTTLQMVYIPKIGKIDADFWSFLLEGAQAAADEFDVNLTLMFPESENDYAGQKQCIRDAIKQKPDAILLTPCSYKEITEAAQEIISAGIKLIVVDSALDKQVQNVLVATDNFEAGTKMGAFFKDHMPVSPQIGIVAHVRGASTAADREAGFRSALGEYEKNVMKTVFCNSDYEKAYNLTVEMLEEYPDMNVLVGLNEYSTLGAARAVRDLGLFGEVQIIGFDSAKEEVQMLEDGLLSAIVIQKPYNMGYLGIESAVKAVRGKKVDREIDSGSLLITKENIYTGENQKLLFPFLDK